jgi:hypothetical protein
MFGVARREQRDSLVGAVPDDRNKNQLAVSTGVHAVRLPAQSFDIAVPVPR